MKNFIIGQFGFFDSIKFKKDIRAGFYGVEACLLKSEEDIRELYRQANIQKLNIGIHFPLRSGVFPYRDPLVLSLNEDKRKQAFRFIEEELEYIKERNISPKYILFHYPKPVIIKDKFDLSRWRFYDKTEYEFESNYPLDIFIKYSTSLFQWLNDKSNEYNFIPVLELDAINKYIMETNILEELLQKYTNVKLCIDIGRIHVQDKIDSSFNSLDILRRFAKYAHVIHLWHAKVGKLVEYNHFPLLPNLKVTDGWANVEAYFEIIRLENKNVKLLFEHRSDMITDEELDLCYNWINELFSRN